MNCSAKVELFMLQVTVAAIMTFIFAGSVLATDAVSLQESEPATIYYTTSGAVPTEPRFPSPSVILSDAPSNELRKAAVKVFKEKMQDSRERDFLLQQGIFANQEEIDLAELGERFQLLHIGEVSADDTPYNPVTHMRSGYSRWLYLVRVDGRVKTVFWRDVGTKAASVGDSGLNIGVGYNDSARFARNLDSFISAWPASEGYRYRIVRTDIVIDRGPANSLSKLISVIEVWQHADLLGFFPLSAITVVPGEPWERTMYERFASGDLIESSQFIARIRASRQKERARSPQQR